jgi:hypothetical protein
MDLPQLSRAAGEGPAEIEVAFGTVPTALPGASQAEPFVHAAPGACLIDSPVARLLVLDGRQILIEAKDDAGAGQILPYLLGSAFAVLCHQRGIVPLHASAITVDETVVAFAGRSGAGKSTLAAQFTGQGARVVADDICAVTLAEGGPVAHLGVNRLKLTAQSLAVLGRSPGGLEAIVEPRGRFALPLAATPATGPWPLSRIYVLDEAEAARPEIRPLSGAAAFSAVFGAIHRWPTAVAMGVGPAVFQRVTEIVGRCAVFALSGAPDPAAPDGRLRQIRASLRR